MQNQQIGLIMTAAMMFILLVQYELIPFVCPQVLLRGQKEPLVITFPLLNQSI